MSVFQSKTKVELELLNNEDVKIKFNSESMEDVIIDRSSMPPARRGAEARKLLAAALAECMSSTLFFLLQWAQIECKQFNATAEVVTAKDENNRLCVDHINLTMYLDIPNDEKSLKSFERTKTLFKRGCLMSRSLKRGINVEYSIVKDNNQCEGSSQT